MRKINFKKAYTLAEVVIVMIVIGIIVGITMQITASKVEQANKYMYYATYTTLKDFATELIADNTDMETLGGGSLCTQIQNRLNLMGQKITVAGKEVTPSCSTAHNLSNKTDFSEVVPNLVLVNGIRLYNLKGALVTISQLNGAADEEKKGYIIYADINASRSSSTLYKDVFPFYLTISGKIIPAYPSSGTAGGNNPNDMMFSVRYDEIKNVSNNETRIEHWLVKSVSFKEAACKSGYETSSTYCNGYTIDTKCSDVGADCVLVPVTPIKYMVP